MALILLDCGDDNVGDDDNHKDNDHAMIANLVSIYFIQVYSSQTRIWCVLKRETTLYKV